MKIIEVQPLKPKKALIRKLKQNVENSRKRLRIEKERQRRKRELERQRKLMRSSYLVKNFKSL